MNRPRRIFAAPFSQLTVPYARVTMRLNHMLQRVELAPPGRAVPGSPPNCTS
ncbi:hypothetical protein [Streptomyces sp. STR69]|uniref:hypothetical protein n=1 Tax=Streptomyces sp. STR69 TaxID=1796942 RepID=UPI0021C7366F|nr:hypothetical protein [Streptomyces sp. STR69]